MEALVRRPVRVRHPPVVALGRVVGPRDERLPEVEDDGAVLQGFLSSFLTSPQGRVLRICSRPQPRSPRLRYAELEVLESAGISRQSLEITILHARLSRQPCVSVAQIEPVRLGVDLEERPGLERLFDDALEVDVGGLATVRACGRSGARCSRRSGCPSRPGLRSVRSLVEPGVDRGHHPVAFGELLVGDIDRAVGLDVGLHALEELEAARASPRPRRSPCSGPRAGRRGGSASGR